MKNSYYTRMQECEMLRTQMDNEISSFKSYWKDISNYILPRRSRFFTTDVNRGDRRNLDIIDPTASLAVRTLSSGMMTGVTSPARPWFKLAGSVTEGQQESADVKAFLKATEDKMRSIFLRSNLYNVLPTIYGDVGAFGTAAMFMERDEENVVNFSSFPIGAYRISCDRKGRVRVFLREFTMTVRQIVEKFGRDKFNPNKINWENISTAVKEQYEKKQYEVKVEVVHIVKPNEEHNPERLQSKYKKFVSLYYEKGTGINGSRESAVETFLSESGYDYFPVMAPRWEVAGEDTYGTNAPGMIALGDVKQLQLGEIRSATAIDQKVTPSMVGPLSLQNTKASIIPGDITYVDERDGQRGFRRLFEIDFDLRELEGKQEQIRQRLSRVFYEDLFLMLANTNRRNITAREIDERHEEKLLALGPVLERLNLDLLDPLIENTFMIMSEMGLLGEMPEELEDADYKIEYISIMAQAQKLAGIGNIERLVGFVGNAMQFDPTVGKKIDFEGAVDVYGDLVGAPPSLVRSKEQMEEIRAQEAEAAAAEQERMEMGENVAAAKQLSETNIDENSALGDLLNTGEFV